MKRSLFIFGSLSLAVALVPMLALAKPAYMQGFKAAYPDANKALATCKLCHEGMGGPRNYYGLEFEKYNHDFKAIEQLDSDGDTVKNIDEINKGTFPGDKNSVLMLEEY